MIGIVGHGYVGQAVHRVFKDAKVYDPGNPATRNKDAINQCELAIICVPTDPRDDGSCDISIVEESVKWIECPLILIKSAIPPGTTDLLSEKYGKRVVVSPEYIGEGKYYVPPEYPHPTEMIRHRFQIFGGNPEDTSAIIEFFVPVVGPHVFFYQTKAKTAEFIKYWENSWGAMKVTFCNEIRKMAECMGIDYWDAREGWALDSRVEKMHTAVFDKRRGYKSKCFDKDIPAFIKCAEENGYEPTLLKEVVETNKRIRGNGQRPDKKRFVPKRSCITQ